MGISTLPRVAVVDGYPELLPVATEAFSSQGKTAGCCARRRLFDVLQEAIALVDREGIVCEWNRAMVQLSGIRREEAVGRNLFALLPADFEKNLAGPVVQAFLYEAPCDGEFMQRHGDNEIFSFQYRVARINVGESRDLAMISVVDKSDRDRLQRQLKKQEQLSMLGKLSSGIAYELAAPLDAICSAIDEILATQENAVNGRIETGLHSILGQVYRISHLTNNIVTLARDDAPALLPVDPHELIAESISSLEQTLHRRPLCNVRFGCQNVPVLADPILLQCALQSILKSAIDAAGDDAIPLLETTVDMSQRFVIRIEDRRHDACSTVAAQVFERLPSAGSFEPGGRFGMLLTKRIVELHKGSVRAEVEAGRGTVYTIVLPTQPRGAKAQVGAL